MKQRKIPMRKDVVSGEMYPKKELVRIVKNQEGEISIDPTGKKNGRGAYVALEPTLIKKAWDKKILDRVLETSLSDAFYQELYDYVEHQKARKELLGK
ncbi:RNase P modulator RnpM [Enterococcus nangangensis]|uniref:RNase P modulator RnpM n=1 Tax=Enterococcus nangangensis TaxID=2559926 RepID=UPI0010F47298|nr:YlxR family protein [Enterococcus nangangensis]